MTADIMTVDVRLFESYLSTALRPAYGTAYYLTQSAETAEGLVQKAAVCAYRAFSSYRPGNNFRAWFLRFVTRLVLGESTKADISPLLHEGEYGLSNLAGDNLTESLCEEEAAEFLGQLTPEQTIEALSTLPFCYRVVCTLYFLDDFTYQEIGEIVEIPVEDVRTRLHRGRRQLRSVFYRMHDPSYRSCEDRNKEGRSFASSAR